MLRTPVIDAQQNFPRNVAKLSVTTAACAAMSWRCRWRCRHVCGLPSALRHHRHRDGHGPARTRGERAIGRQLRETRCQYRRRAHPNTLSWQRTVPEEALFRVVQINAAHAESVDVAPGGPNFGMKPRSCLVGGPRVSSRGRLK